jgi:DNA replication protein DnaC
VLEDKTYEYLEDRFPFKAGHCPTCGDTGHYRLDGEQFECDCELQSLLQKHYFAANIGREYHDICLQDFLGVDRENVIPIALKYIEQWQDNFHYGVGVTASGPVGTGKTFLISSILKEFIKLGKNVYFITFEELIDV